MPTNTANKILVADGTSFEVNLSGDATIASGGAIFYTRGNSAITCSHSRRKGRVTSASSGSAGACELRYCNGSRALI